VICLIIVDAWKEVEDTQFPMLQSQMDTFLAYLNIECQSMKLYHKIDIFHDLTGREKSNYIEMFDGIQSVDKIDYTKYDVVLLCGAHLNVCIHSKYLKIISKHTKVGVVMNLSLSFPKSDLVNTHIPKIPYFYYTQLSGFTQIQYFFYDKYIR